MQTSVQKSYIKTPSNPKCNLVGNFFKGGSTLDALSQLVTLSFPNLGTKFILRVVACHITRFSKSCNVKNKINKINFVENQGEKKLLFLKGNLKSHLEQTLVEV